MSARTNLGRQVKQGYVAEDFSLTESHGQGATNLSPDRQILP